MSEGQGQKADLSKRLDMTLAAVSYAVKRGEKVAKKQVVIWMIELFEYLRTSPSDYAKKK
ncbi:MAG: hypothetical protein U9R02_09835 [Thermodesulfobacteriota bacterium]|nr:hypothetical protein [Thermodesulfobacteriota bacterium]